MLIASEVISSGNHTGLAASGRLRLGQWQSIGHTIAGLPLLALQVLGLWGFELTGTWAVKAAQLPIPGNLVGMVGLYLLLSLGLVKVSWFDAAGSFLIKHLAFFFIPITVGLMDAGHLLAVHGLGIALILVVSAGAGILLSGFVAQSLASNASPAGEDR
jgi:holin-like protein